MDNIDLRTNVLRHLANLLDEHRDFLIEENIQDMHEVGDKDVALIDRLKIDHKKIDDMQKSLLYTATFDNPDHKVIHKYIREDGLIIENKTVPFGTILIVYESRPDVTVEAAAMAFKSGNKVWLKGGKEAHRSNKALVKLWHQALASYGIDITYVQYMALNRSDTQALISNPKSGIDLIIPRGGDALIDFVKQNASVPVIESGRGNNFVFVHQDADPNMAIRIIKDGKSRISVCNATDKVLIHQKWIETTFLNDLYEVLEKMNIQIMVDAAIFDKIGKGILCTNEEELNVEYLAPKILLKSVSTTQEAIHIINTYSGHHSASIVTKNIDAAQEFMNKVDTAAVYHNASTRFTDGGQMGFGGEMAISTQKLHFRGPIGVSQLVSNKWYISGDGHTRT